MKDNFNAKTSLIDLHNFFISSFPSEIMSDRIVQKYGVFGTATDLKVDDFSVSLQRFPNLDNAPTYILSATTPEYGIWFKGSFIPKKFYPKGSFDFNLTEIWERPSLMDDRYNHYNL